VLPRIRVGRIVTASDPLQTPNQLLSAAFEFVNGSAAAAGGGSSPPGIGGVVAALEIGGRSTLLLARSGTLEVPSHMAISVADENTAGFTLNTKTKDFDGACLLLNGTLALAAAPHASGAAAAESAWPAVELAVPMVILPGANLSWAPAGLVVRITHPLTIASAVANLSAIGGFRLEVGGNIHSVFEPEWEDTLPADETADPEGGAAGPAGQGSRPLAFSALDGVRWRNLLAGSSGTTTLTSGSSALRFSRIEMPETVISRQVAVTFDCVAGCACSSRSGLVLTNAAIRNMGELCLFVEDDVAGESPQTFANTDHKLQLVNAAGATLRIEGGSATCHHVLAASDAGFDPEVARTTWGPCPLGAGNYVLYAPTLWVNRGTIDIAIARERVLALTSVAIVVIGGTVGVRPLLPAADPAYSELIAGSSSPPLPRVLMLGRSTEDFESGAGGVVLLGGDALAASAGAAANVGSWTATPSTMTFADDTAAPISVLGTSASFPHSAAGFIAAAAAGSVLHTGNASFPSNLARVDILLVAGTLSVPGDSADVVRVVFLFFFFMFCFMLRINLFFTGLKTSPPSPRPCVCRPLLRPCTPLCGCASARVGSLTVSWLSPTARWSSTRRGLPSGPWAPVQS
jgi:hypothetical protein